MNKAGEEKNKGSVGEYMNQKKTSAGTSKDPGFKQRMQNGYNDKYMKQKGQKPKSVMSEKRPPNMKSKFMGPNKDKK